MPIAARCKNGRSEATKTAGFNQGSGPFEKPDT
jgi:hypothetical protein